MNTVAFPLPDGTSIDVPLGMPYEQAEALAKKARPDAFKGKQESGFFANVKGGYRDLMANNALGIGA